jgi:predicted Zn-dependent peptidase
MDDSTFQKTTLPNGLRILTERHPHVHSATIGVWAVAGSVYEDDNERGIAHLLEHMVFKGTPSRSAQQIAATMDSIGGQLNAFTNHEFVCFHAKVLSEHTVTALELLCDMVTNPRLDTHDLELEKGVILEEINSVEDAPEEMVEELFTTTIWRRSRWGRPILGTRESVSGFTAADVRNYMKKHYSPRNLVVVAVGEVEHADIVRRAEKLLRALPGARNKTLHRQPRQPTVQAHQIQMSRDTEQVHLCCGTRAYSYSDPQRFAAWTLDTILTSGYSSRLFQEIREKRGLCYNIGPLSASYRSAGYWAVETSVAPEVAPRVVGLIGRELRKVKASGVTRDELKRAKQMARANILLAEESSSAQMSRIARNELYYGRQKSAQEALDNFAAVTPDDIYAVANEMFDPQLMNLAAIGPFAEGANVLQIDVG